MRKDGKSSRASPNSDDAASCKLIFGAMISLHSCSPRAIYNFVVHNTSIPLFVYIYTEKRFYARVYLSLSHRRQVLASQDRLSAALTHPWLALHYFLVLVEKN